MYSAYASGAFIGILSAAGTVHIVGVAEADAMANLMGDHFVDFVHRVQVAGRAAACAKRESGRRVAAGSGEASRLSENTATTGSTEISACDHDIATRANSLKPDLQVEIIVAGQCLVETGRIM